MPQGLDLGTEYGARVAIDEVPVTAAEFLLQLTGSPARMPMKEVQLAGRLLFLQQVFHHDALVTEVNITGNMFHQG